MRFDGKTTKQQAVDININKLSVCSKPAHELATSRIIKESRDYKDKDKEKTKKKEGETEMKKEEVNALIEKSVGDLQAKLKVAETIAKMDDKTKSYYNGLGEKDQDEFLKMTNEEQKELAEPQPVVEDETLSANGITINKSSVGAEVFNFMKAQQEEVAQAKEIARLEKEKRELQDFTKQAELMFPNLPGESVKKGLVMKQLAAMPDQVRDVLTTMLKTGNEAIEKSQAFEEIGSDGVPLGGDDTPISKLNKMAVDRAAAKNITFADAYDEIIETPEGKELYAKYQKNIKKGD